MDLKRPRIQQLKARTFPDFEDYKLKNGARLVVIKEPGWKVFRLEACFMAGRPFEQKRAVAKSTAQLLKEGSSQYDSLALAEHFEGHGASIKSKSGIDTAHILMHGPISAFHELFPVFQEIVTSPSFSEKELDKFVKNQKERLLTDLSINEVISYRKFTEGLFGPSHPYGYNSLPEDYESITKQDLQDHYQMCYSPEKCIFLLSGGVTEAMINEIRTQLEDWSTPFQGKRSEATGFQPKTGIEKLEKGSTYQASIRMGKKLFSFDHPDYPYAQIASTLLGGYFGSRLMRKVRQEEGLSYNIYSTVEPMLFDGYWMIATETGIPNVDIVIELIETELRKLAEEKIKTREMEMIRNYLIGNSLQFFEGAFNKSDFLRHHLFETGETNIYPATMDAILEMDSEKIRHTAERYFQPEDMFTLVVE